MKKVIKSYAEKICSRSLISDIKIEEVKSKEPELFLNDNIVQAIRFYDIEYIIDKLYLVLEHHPEKAQSYIDYRNSIIKRIIDIHEKNLDFERRNPVRYYSKEPRKRTRSSNRVNQSKDVFTGKPIDVSTGIAKAIKPKKETIAQRKAKLLGGKAVSFAFNGLKISEHNE